MTKNSFPILDSVNQKRRSAALLLNTIANDFLLANDAQIAAFVGVKHPAIIQLRRSGGGFSDLNNLAILDKYNYFNGRILSQEILELCIHHEFDRLFALPSGATNLNSTKRVELVFTENRRGAADNAYLLDRLLASFGLKNDFAIAKFLGVPRQHIWSIRKGFSRLTPKSRLKIVCRLDEFHQSTNALCFDDIVQVISCNDTMLKAIEGCGAPGYNRKNIIHKGTSTTGGETGK